MDSINLTKKLVSIPSYVGQNSNEILLAKYIEAYFKKYLPQIKLKRQYLNDSQRFNLIASPKQAEILVVGHMDTVPPQSSWTSDPFNPSVSNSNLTGLGAADMKGSLACFISALSEAYSQIDPAKLAILFYCDEEYSFSGMKEFIKNPPNIKPNLILSLDGKPYLSSGCRGLIEIAGVATGKSGPAAKPYLGNNAIEQFVSSYQTLSNSLSSKFDPVLGLTTTNLAYLRGGYKTSSSQYGQIGNIIPDNAEFLLEIRPSVKKINASYILRKLTQICQTKNISLSNLKINFDYSPWVADYNSQYFSKLTNIVSEIIPKPATTNSYYSGFIDTALLNQIFPQIPKFVYGAGGQNQHSANESVEISSLLKTTQVYGQILEKIL